MLNFIRHCSTFLKQDKIFQIWTRFSCWISILLHKSYLIEEFTSAKKFKENIKAIKCKWTSDKITCVFVYWNKFCLNSTTRKFHLISKNIKSSWNIQCDTFALFHWKVQLSPRKLNHKWFPMNIFSKHCYIFFTIIKTCMIYFLNIDDLSEQAALGLVCKVKVRVIWETNNIFTFNCLILFRSNGVRF
jgi:hypothetical protein